MLVLLLLAASGCAGWERVVNYEQVKRQRAARSYRQQYAAACAQTSARSSAGRIRRLGDGTHDGLADAELRELISSHLADVSTCYDRALDIWPQLYGRVVVRAGIAPAGYVQSSALVSTDTGVKELGCCVAAAMLGWETRPMDVLEPVIFEYSYRFVPQG